MRLRLATLKIHGTNRPLSIRENGGDLEKSRGLGRLDMCPCRGGTSLLAIRELREYILLRFSDVSVW